MFLEVRFKICPICQILHFCPTILLWWAGYIPVNFDRVFWVVFGVCFLFSPTGYFVLGIFSPSLWQFVFYFSLLILYLSFTFRFRFLPSCCPFWLVHLSAVPISVLHYADVSVSNLSIMLHRERLSTKDGTLYHIHPGQFVVLCTSGCHNLKWTVICVRIEPG